ncbi:hypothetical protein CVT26_007743 [Gymnopilus dilepis]|uniref:Uncharacterized protein n=1 Tax=Gymnopilus dilepis TaxID=231916 RepID=A0A409X691_9AGAR|nr:hypothetical protein CVT26_007743 [Gymnopilus dilepis]
MTQPKAAAVAIIAFPPHLRSGRSSEQEVGPDPDQPMLSCQARAHLPRIEERARGGCSTVWCAVAVVAAAVLTAAAGPASRLVTKLREGDACWGLRPPSPCPWLVCEDELSVWLALSHPGTTNPHR